MDYGAAFDLAEPLRRAQEELSCERVPLFTVAEVLSKSGRQAQRVAQEIVLLRADIKAQRQDLRDREASFATVYEEARRGAAGRDVGTNSKKKVKKFMPLWPVWPLKLVPR